MSLSDHLQAANLPQSLTEQLKSKASYRAALRANVRALWVDGTDEGFVVFLNRMRESINRGFQQAWAAGLKQVGLTLADQTPAEAAKLQGLQMEEYSRVFAFGEDIIAGSKDNGGKLAPLFKRVDVWAQRYPMVQSEAVTLARENPPLEWVMDPGKENCSTCAKLNGKVKRARWWQDNGILPAVPGAAYLECRGFNCGCTLKPSSKGLSRGRMPSLP